MSIPVAREMGYTGQCVAEAMEYVSDLAQDDGLEVPELRILALQAVARRRLPDVLEEVSEE